ncbi:molecular chaperone [Cedecea sp.]|jgi:P pilus assembly chaperone PapD|uniref:fimbrial biogenesis chaperone n=1 Tax=Cedecea sp. TaxID=1970739 RepID=UPI002F3FE4AB
MKFVYIFMLVILNSVVSDANAALSLDRTRLIINEEQNAVSLRVTNKSESDPYLAQGWVEDADGQLIDQFMVVPPVQRIEAGQYSIFRLQQLAKAMNLPKDRESVFYFNLREIPQKSHKENVLTLAIQTRIKVFWRPKSLKVTKADDTVPGMKAVTLVKSARGYEINNPTSYYLSITGLELKEKVKIPPFMVPPKGSYTLKHQGSEAVEKILLTAINDYGSPRTLSFSCRKDICQIEDIIIPKR